MQLYELFTMSQQNPTLFEAIAATLLLYGTHANRPSATNVPNQCLYFCSTHNLIYQAQAGAWVTVGPTSGGGSGALTHIETISLSAPATAITFSGLDGDTQQLYKLVFSVISAEDNNAVSVQPNGTTSDLSAARVFSGGYDTPSEWVLHTLYPDESAAYTCELNATKSQGAVSIPRRLNGIGAMFNNAGGAQGQLSIGGNWQNTADNLTSIVITGTQTDGLAAGSWAALYNYAL